MKSWSLPPSQFAALTVKEHTNLCKTVAIEVGKRLVMKTPVDTGRAKSGWLPSFEQPATGEGVPDPSGSGAIQKIVTEFAGGEKAFAIYYLTNNVPYIGALNNGSSK